MNIEIQIRIIFVYKQNTELEGKTLYLLLALSSKYAYETWFTIQEKLVTFERKVLRKINGPKRNVNGENKRKKTRF